MASPEIRVMPRVGLLYDERMCRHATPDGERHPESPQRIRAIWRNLESHGITQRCVLLNAKPADDKHIATVHTKRHIDLIRSISSREFDSQRQQIASSFDSVYLNQGSSEAAYLAAGSVIEACEKVAMGDLNSAVAIVRPPGHHAEPDEAMGFCLFNNVAIAANVLLNERQELGIKKILIVDWDVHHGNGTQKVFYKDPRVLFFSVHRFDYGSFYPGGDDGSLSMIGEDRGAGYNINFPWEHGQCGDADYVAVWDHVLIPIAEAYNPDIILVSAGFDAAMDDPLGGCCITPFGYSLMLSKLMRFAGGKIVMALEGGYNLNSISTSVLACVKTLLEEKPIDGSIEGRPYDSTWRVIKEVRNELKTYWPIVSAELPAHILITNDLPPPSAVFLPYSSDSDIEDNEGTSNSIYNGDSVDGITLPLANLNFDDNSYENHISLNNQVDNFCAPWRSVLSKIEVWYASYGSNMWKDRFLCYIKGGKVDGMNEPCHGSMDKSLPRDVMRKIVPHKLFFARSYTPAWGTGGVAFLHPETNINDRAYLSIYKITLDQFNDVLFQENSNVLYAENGTSQHIESPLLDVSQIELLAETKTMVLDILKDGWYSNVLYLGKEDGIPILTMTCPFSHLEHYKAANLPMLPPSKEYVNTLVKGLVEGKQLTNEEAIEYIHNATINKL